MKDKKELQKTIWGTGILIAGIILMVIGIRNEEIQMVLDKAIHICMEGISSIRCFILIHIKMI